MILFLFYFKSNPKHISGAIGSLSTITTALKKSLVKSFSLVYYGKRIIAENPYCLIKKSLNPVINVKVIVSFLPFFFLLPSTHNH